MKPHEFRAAIAVLFHGCSWADARRAVAAELSLAEAGAMLEETWQQHHDARETVHEKLRALGGKLRALGGKLRADRSVEVRLDVHWRTRPDNWIDWCPDDVPSPHDRDWLVTDDLDLNEQEELRVQSLADDVTLVLTMGDGAVAFRTSLRVA